MKDGLYIDDYLEDARCIDESTAWQELIQEARRVLVIYREGQGEPVGRSVIANNKHSSFDSSEVEGGTPRDPDRRIEGRIETLWKDYRPSLGAYEQELSESLGEYVALCAEIDPYLRRFRREVLDGRLLTSEQAHSFVESPANHCFSHDWFKERQIPIVGHSATWTSWDPDTEEVVPEDVKYVERQMPTVGYWPFGPSVIYEPGVAWTYNVHITPPNKTYSKEVFYPSDENPERRPLYFPSRQGDFINEYRVLRGEPYLYSVLDRLRALGNTLGSAFRPWTLAQRMWFVLTGQATPTTAVTGHLGLFEPSEGLIGPNMRRRRDTVTLSIDPWVPAATVSKVYRELRREAMGQNSRAVPKRSIALFRFVVRELRESLLDADLSEGQVETYRAVIDKAKGRSVEAGTRTTKGGRPTWRVLRERWNSTCSNTNWRCKRDSNFSRDFYQAASSILRSTRRMHF